MKTLRGVFPLHRERLPTATLREGRYEVAFARTAHDIDAIQRLRFEVFNLEMGEGLEASFETGRDVDEFDAVCHHLMVTERTTGQVVGCYRMQTAATARTQLGFYSASLFDLSALPRDAIERSVEVGRACVAKSHRSSLVLFLLWKGLALYVAHNQVRYLFGCCSLTSQDPTDGSAVLAYLRANDRMHPEWSVAPRASSACPIDPGVAPASGVPTLFRTYLRYGAKVCGLPAIDREFKTIDFLVVLDVDALSPRTHRMFFG